MSSLQALERVANGELRDLAGQPDAFTEGFWYDEQGRQIRHVSFEGVVMQSVYDDTPAGRGRLVEKRYFPTVAAFADGHGSAAQVETYSFDVLGRQISTTRLTPQPLGQAPGHTETLTSVYDSRGRLASESTTSSLHPHAASRIGYEYDLLGRKIRTYTGTAAAPITDIRYSYNVLGQLFTVETLTRDGRPVDVKPDLNNPGNQPEITKHYYDLLGRLSRQELPNDVVTGYTYDPGTDNIDKLTHYRSDGNNIDLTDNPKKAQFDYTTRADGKKTRSVETFWFDHDQNAATPDIPRSATYDWIYDDVGRLTSERIDHWDNLLDRTEAFTMDLFGNRVERTLDKGNDGTIEERTTYTYDANDRLLEEILDDLVDDSKDTNTTYTWDHTQQTSKTSVTSASSVVQTFSYNLQGRLAAVTSETSDSNNTVTGRTQVEYTYDSRGIRIRASDYVSDLQTSDFTLQTATEYLVDHHNFTGYAQSVEERIYSPLPLGEGQGEGFSLVKRITYTFGYDELTQTTTEFDPISQLATSNSTLIFGHDALTNVRVLFEAAATIAQAYTFAAYGQLLAVHNANASFQTSNFTLQTSVLADGEYFDTRIGQTYLRARWYEPNAGRFSRLDPFAGSRVDPNTFNKYGYVAGDSINYSDPTGLVSAQVSIGIGIGLGFAAGAGLGTANFISGGLRYSNLTSGQQSGDRLMRIMIFDTVEKGFTFAYFTSPIGLGYLAYYLGGRIGGTSHDYIMATMWFPGKPDTQAIVKEHAGDIKDAALATGIPAELLASLLMYELNQYSVTDFLFDDELLIGPERRSIGIAQLRLDILEQMDPVKYRVDSETREKLLNRRSAIYVLADVVKFMTTAYIGTDTTNIANWATISDHDRERIVRRYTSGKDALNPLHKLGDGDDSWGQIFGVERGLRWIRGNNVLD